MANIDPSVSRRKRQDFTAIQTRYAQCFFRSRLEARYAVFFDTLGVKWEYEKEGFVLPHFGCYLPDFWLPEFRVWVEIKGSVEMDYWTATAPEQKLRMLCKKTTDRGFLFVGTPDPSDTLISIIYLSGEHARLERERGLADLLFSLLGYSIDEPIGEQAGAAFLKIVQACEAAKSARFEFGETPEARG